MYERFDRRYFVGTVAAAVTLSWMIVGCAAGDSRFSVDTPAGFWAGLWHGIISMVALVVGLFHSGVEVYERSNSGGWYDFGFLVGVSMIWGGGSHTAARRGRSRREQEQWEQIGRSVEAKVQRRIRQWADAEPDEAWEVVGAKAEAKLKRKIRQWAEKPEGQGDEPDAPRGGPVGPKDAPDDLGSAGPPSSNSSTS
ncbi:MAG: hypothetical protein K0V04_43575 [Deltaproteobacteria bacterium]|nr:hypothetical protein [Deltaproteobacteria bacterium]